MAARYKVELDQNAIKLYVNDRSGPMFGFLMQAARGVRDRAVSQLSGFPRTYLVPRIQVKPTSVGGILLAIVGTEDTVIPPHIIEGNPTLKFIGKSGDTVYAPSVNHPGMDLGPYLGKVLEQAVRSSGMKYTPGPVTLT